MNDLQKFIVEKTKKSYYGDYHSNDIESLAVAPKNEKESQDYANALSGSGYYPAGLGGCFTVGISGGCSKECWVFQKGECEEPVEGFYNWEMTTDELGELYDNGYYIEEIDKYREHKPTHDEITKLVEREG